MNWRNILERAGWTAFQTGVGSLTATQIADALFGVDSAEQAVVIAVTTAISTALSFFKTVATERLAQLEKEIQGLE